MEHKLGTTRSWARSLALIAAAAVLLAACGNGNAPTTTAKVGGTLRIGLEAESSGWVQTGATGGYSTYFVMDALYDSIMKRDASGTPQPFFAQSVTPDSTYATWTVKLRPGVVYADGTAVTGPVLKAMFDELLAPSSASRATLSDIDTTAAVDDQTLKINLKAASPWFSYVLSNIFVFEPGLQQKYGKDYGAHPMGTGPFELVSWDRNQQMTLKKNPHYWRKDASGHQLPYLDELVFHPIVDPSSRLASLQSGDLDVIMSSDPNTLTRADSAGLTVRYRLDSSGYEFAFNTLKPPLDDVRVRQALAYATDRPSIVAAAGGSKKYQVVRYQYLAPGTPYFSTAVDDAALKYDLTKAKALVQQYVNDPKRSDGKAVGSPVGFEILSVPDANTVAQDQTAQSEWGQAGFQVTIKTEVQAARIGDVIKGLHQAVWIQWGEQDPYHVLNTRYREVPAGVASYAFYSRFGSSQIQTDLDSLVSANPSDAKKAVQDIGLVVDKEAPAIPLGSGVMGLASSSKVKGGPSVLSGQTVYRTDWAVVSLG